METCSRKKCLKSNLFLVRKIKSFNVFLRKNSGSCAGYLNRTLVESLVPWCFPTTRLWALFGGGFVVLGNRNRKSERNHLGV